MDKIVGDAVVSFFGAPSDQPDHAAMAVHCALKLDAFARQYAEDQQARGINFGITRIGVNTGMTAVGNFGGDAFFNYTAHGDAVNTAARMESVNKHLGNQHLRRRRHRVALHRRPVSARREPGAEGQAGRCRGLRAAIGCRRPGTGDSGLPRGLRPHGGGGPDGAGCLHPACCTHTRMINSLPCTPNAWQKAIGAAPSF